VTAPRHGDEVAEVAARLGALLAAGLPTAAAWRHLADAETTSPGLRAAAEDARHGRSPAGSLAVLGGEWRELAVALALAERTGAPVGSALAAIADALREAEAARADVDAALAGPKLSARVVLALPAVAVLFALGLGVDVIGALQTSAGLTVLAGGCLLYLAGALWIRRLAASAQPASAVPGLGLDLVALALSAGLPLIRAQEAVAEEAAAAALPLDLDAAVALGELGTRAGAPVAGLLRAEASGLRRRAAADAKVRAARLGVLLLLPLGVCMLPAFLLVGVVPVLLGLLTSAVPV
jgi:tight adherence protein B